MVKRILTLFFLIILIITIFLHCSDSLTESNNISDGWEIVSPESQGMNSLLLNTLTQQIHSNSMGEISSLLIVRNGKLLYEEYFNGAESTDLHNVYSVTKSVTSVLIGIAIEEGKIGSISDKIYPYFSEYDLFDNMTPFKDSITIEHVLQMRAGFLWEEITIPYGNQNNSFTQMYNSNDLVKFVLDLPLSDSPGSTFVYNTGGSMVLGGILVNQYDYSVEQLANRVLFEPLGITNYQWRQQHNGFIPTGTGLTLMPRDMAKFGLLCLQDGIWKGDTIVHPTWLAQSHQAYSRFISGNGYGYHWWLRELSVNDQNQLIPEAMGWGNQYITVIKDLNIVVVSTAENYNNFTQYIYDILNNYIIPSAG